VNGRVHGVSTEQSTEHELYQDYLEYCRRKKALPMAFEDWTVNDSKRREITEWAEGLTETLKAGAADTNLHEFPRMRESVID
jgi:hypothetical protein